VKEEKEEEEGYSLLPPSRWNKDSPPSRRSKNESPPSRRNRSPPRARKDSSPRRRRPHSPSSPRSVRSISSRGSPPFEEMQYGKPEHEDETEEVKPKIKKEKPDYNPSGKLNTNHQIVNGIPLKWAEPSEARQPTKKWRLYVFKGEQALDPYFIHHQSAYLFGREREVADIPTDHPTCSKQHAVLQYRMIQKEDEEGEILKIVKPYIMDLESTNGTFLNGERVESMRYYELKERDVIKFGTSTREFVLLHEESVD